MPTISSLKARWILDSRGFPTVYCEIQLEKQGVKYTGSGSVPSGASTGTYEALEMRDGGSDFHGKGVQKAVDNINQTVASYILGKEFRDAKELDEMILSLDKSENKSELGANAILAISIASHRAFASVSSLEVWQYLRRLYFAHLTNPTKSKFPRLMCNIINGGVHADSGLSIQEFMVVPNTGNIQSDVQAASEIYHSLKKSLAAKGHSISLGDEGGFAPRFASAKNGGSVSAIKKMFDPKNLEKIKN